MNPVLLPLVAVQGYQAVRHTVALPEAGGARVGDVPGREPALRVDVVGESTAAGCGADTHGEAFAGSLARALARRSGRSVRWRVAGRNGATLRQTRDDLLPRLGGAVDLAVLLIGANDVLRNTPLRRWAADLAAAVDSLHARSETVVVAGVPPFEHFPSLPAPLRTFLAARGRRLDAAARRVCETRPGVVWTDSRSQFERLRPDGFFARDGFHPSAEGYRGWAEAVLDDLLPH